MTPNQQKIIDQILNSIILVDGVKTINDVYLYNFNLTKLPDLSDMVVNGDFYCGYNQLTSLQGCPHTINGSFFCENNQLTSLEYAPTFVQDSFFCSGNQLTSLKGCPDIIHRGFHCNHNQLTSLDYAPTKIKGIFSGENNPWNDLNITNSLSSQEYQQIKEEHDHLAYIKANPVPIITITIDI